MQNEEFIVVGQLFDMERFTNAQFVLKKLGPTQSKFSDFKRFALSPRLIIMQWVPVPVVDRLLIPLEDTVLNVKIQFVQIVKEVLWKLGSFHLSFRVFRDSKVKILVGQVFV